MSHQLRNITNSPIKFKVNRMSSTKGEAKRRTLSARSRGRSGRYAACFDKQSKHIRPFGLV